MNNINLNNKINYTSFDLVKFVLQLKNEYNDKIAINNIIHSIKKLYLEYNYGVGLKIPKLIFYEKYKII